jgi:threonine/homoserine/homoserine lactone efflux protein
MFNLISQGVSLGFSAGAMPGPFQSYLISSALAYGWRRSLVIILTPLITDGPIILLTVVILKQVPADFIRAVQIIGGLYLLWIAYHAWQRFRTGISFTTANEPPAGRTLTQGLFMNWLSPGPYIFWATINGPLLVSGLGQSLWHGLAFLLAFYGTFLGFLALYMFIFDRMRRLDERITRVIFLLTIAVLVVFGLSLVRQGMFPG